jgi:hypothetical protein
MARDDCFTFQADFSPGFSQAGAAGTEALNLPRGAADHDLGYNLMAPACEI